MSTSDSDSSMKGASASESSPELAPRIDATTAAEPEPSLPSQGISEAEASSANDASDSKAPDAEKPKKRRRKRRKESDRVISEMRPELDEDGRDRPRFLLAFPKDPELEKLIAAFEVGNYARVRELAPKLIESSEEPEVQAAAREILRRIEPDPLVKLLLFAAVALFAVVVVYVYQVHG